MGKLKVTWEGLCYLNSSFAIVNREMVRALSRRSDVDIRFNAWGEGIHTGFEVDHEIQDVIPIGSGGYRSVENPLEPHRESDVYVRHSWPCYAEGEGDPMLGWVNIPQAKCRVGLVYWESMSIRASWHDQMRTVDRVMVATESTKKNLVLNGFEKSRVAVIPAGYSPEIFHPEVDPTNVGTYKKFKFLHLGAAQQRKGSFLLIEAYMKEFTRKDNVALIIVSFALPYDFEKYIKTMKTPDSPKIIYDFDEGGRPVEEVAGYYTACDCAVYPAILEGFGMTMLEAMGSGLPLICTDRGAHRAFVSNDSAILVESERRPYQFLTDGVGDVCKIDSLRAAMRAAYENDGKILSRLREKGLEQAAGWTWEKAGEKFVQQFGGFAG